MKFDISISANIHIHNDVDSKVLDCINAKLHRLEEMGLELLEGKATQAEVDQLTAKLRGSTDKLEDVVQEQSPK